MGRSIVRTLFFFLRVANGRHTTSEINFQSKRVSSFSSRSIIHKSPRSLEEIPKKNQSKNAERRHRSCRRFFQPSVIDRAAKEKQIVVAFFFSIKAHNVMLVALKNRVICRWSGRGMDSQLIFRFIAFKTKENPSSSRCSVQSKR